MDKSDLIKQINKNETGGKNCQKEILRIACWNIRRGLISKELEIRNILREEMLNILFLTETDTMAISDPKDYQIEGYKTVLPILSSENKKVRIICLIENSISHSVKVRTDNMNDKFPTIWLEHMNPSGQNTTIGGFYREWNNNGEKSVGDQVARIENLTTQIEEVSSETRRVIILGMRICAR